MVFIERFTMLDEKLMSSILTPGNCTVVGGRPAMGKTAFALDLISKLTNDGVKVEYLSYDNSEEELIKKLENRSFDESNLHIADCRNTDIDKRIKYIEDTNLVVIDYLQKCNEAKGEDLIKRFKKMGEKGGFAVLVLSQLSRDIERRRNPIPRLTDLPESYIVDDADNILFLYRPAYYDYNAPREEGHIIVAKREPYEISAIWDTPNASWSIAMDN